MRKIPQIANEDIELQLLEDEEFRAVRDSANILLEKVFKDGSANDPELKLDRFWPSLKSYRPDPHLVLLPLDRVGSELGFTRTKVLIGYFRDVRKRTGGRVHPSQPLVIKVGRPNKDKGKCYLEDERNRAVSVKKFPMHEKDAFAWPLHFARAENHSSCSVLWSSFYSSIPSHQLTDPDRLALKQKGLYTILAGDLAPGFNGRTDSFGNNIPDEHKEASRTLIRVYDCLKPLHWRGKESPGISGKPQSIVQYYKKYLRGFRSKGSWGDAWRNIWGPDKKTKVSEGDMTFYNPIYILKSLRSLKKKVCVGAIHGDLHPRNIVFARDGAPHIIDFGWTKKISHIAKDFVLMECNLRFMVLRPDIPLDALKALVNWIPFHNKYRPTGNEYIDRRAKVIETLHEIARCHFPSNTNWDWEYVIPLFLMSLGLMKPKTFASCHNRCAAKLTVLKQADYIGNILDL